MKIVIKMLVNSTAPLAVAKNLESIVRLICPNIIIEEYLNIDYIRK